MKKLIILVLLIHFNISASNLSEIRDVLKHVETNHNPFAVGDGGDSWGILQIQEGVIEDINRRYGTDYAHRDAFDINCAEEIFELYITMWSEKLEEREKRDVTEFDIVRIWNGGPKGYKKQSTLKYLKKYKEYKEKLLMNRRQCIVNGRLGIVMATYTHTMDVYIFKSRRTMTGVNRQYVRLLPKQEKKGNESQLMLAL